MRSLRRARRGIRLVALALIVAAVSQELSRPKSERTWHGRVFDLVPYDFRMPTLGRLRDAYWNPGSDRLFTDRVLGVGWAINFHRAQQLAGQALGSLGRGGHAAPVRRGRPARRVPAASGRAERSEEPATPA